MLIEYFHIIIPIYLSLAVVVACLAGAILFSMYKTGKEEKLSKDTTAA